MMHPVKSENSPDRVVFAGQGPVLVTDSGTPYPPPQVVEALRLRRPDLKIEWLQAAWGLSGWIIKEKWPEGSPKWARVRCGECSEENAFDQIARFPAGMRMDEMVSWCENNLGRVRDPRKEAERMIAAAQKLMADSQEEGVNQMVEQGTQRILDESDHLRLVRGGFEDAHSMITVPAEVDREPKRLL